MAFVRNGINSEPVAVQDRWIEEQKELLPESGAKQVVSNIKLTNSPASGKEKLINYYQTDTGRMD
jgi:hypothetical protein